MSIATDIQVARREIKYHCTRVRLFSLMKLLDMQLVRDKNDSGQGYTVRSLYFDSPYERDRWEGVQGVEERKKIRMRIYGLDDKSIKLEHKYKLGVNQKKSTLFITREQALAFEKGDVSFLQSKEFVHDVHDRMPGTEYQLLPGASAIFRAVKMDVYRPRVLLEFKRLAWVGPLNNIRVTWDSEIRASRTNLSLFAQNVNWTTLLDKSTGVLEIKYDAFFCSYIEDLLMGMEALPQSFSKYLLSCSL